MFQQFPILRACNQGQGFAGSQLYRKVSRTAEILEMIVAALPLNSVVDVAADLLINDEHLPMRLQAESQRGRSLKRMHFQTAARHRKREGILDRDTQRAIMHTKCQIRPERQRNRTAAD